MFQRFFLQQAVTETCSLSFTATVFRKGELAVVFSTLEVRFVSARPKVLPAQTFEITKRLINPFLFKAEIYHSSDFNML
jgi:hypothetical protein